MASLVLTVLGDDRAGIVSELSAPIKAHGGSVDVQSDDAETRFTFRLPALSPTAPASP